MTRLPAALALTTVLALVPQLAAASSPDAAETAEDDGLSATGAVAPISADRDAAFDFEQPAITVTEAPEPEPEAEAGSEAAPEPAGYAFDVTLWGHQEALDLCAGWVYEDFMRGDVVSAHNHCGGDVVLGLDVGDTVTLTGHGAGTYAVTQLKTVPKGTSTAVLEGGFWMQTCLWDGVNMRLARLAPA